MKASLCDTPGSKILLTIFLADKFVLLLMVGFVLLRRLVYLPTHTSDPYMVRSGMWERQAIVIASCKRRNKSESKLSSFKKIGVITLANESIIKNGGKVNRAFSSSLGNIKWSLSIFEFKWSWYCYWETILSSRSADWKHLPVSFTAVLWEKNEGNTFDCAVIYNHMAPLAINRFPIVISLTPATSYNLHGNVTTRGRHWQVIRPTCFNISKWTVGTAGSTSTTKTGFPDINGCLLFWAW